MVILFLVLTPSHFTHSSAMDERRVRPFDPGEMAIDPIPTYDYHYHHQGATTAVPGCLGLAVRREDDGATSWQWHVVGVVTSLWSLDCMDTARYIRKSWC